MGMRFIIGHLVLVFITLHKLHQSEMCQCLPSDFPRVHTSSLPPEI